MFARFFSKERDDSTSSNVHDGRQSIFSEKRERLSKKIENSKTVNAVTGLASRALTIKMKTIGTYLITFAAYVVLFALISLFLNDDTSGRWKFYVRLSEALVPAVLAVPCLASGKTLSEVLSSSRICTFAVRAFGFSEESLSVGGECGKFSRAFVLGIISGLLSLVISPLYILCAIAAVIYVYAVLATPEFGLLSMFFLMPFAPTMALAALTILTDFSFLVKLIRKKRVLRFSRIDFMVLLFAILLFIGGFVSLSSGSIKPAVLMVCFISAYFQVSCCVRSEKWLIKCITALIYSALITAFYGILQYVLGSSMNASWIDTDLFEGIAGRATATLENPNVLGEYLIMIIPIACSVWMAGVGIRRKNSFCALACMAMCLILTWSRGAWLGFLFSFVVLLLVWNRRSIWLFICGVASIPLLSVVLPSTIISRFTSIGDLADSSTSYRLSIWRGTVHMLGDIFMSGIGVGNPAWKQIYSEYSLVGITAAEHSHNLFLQIAVDLGAPGLLVFLIFLVMLTRCAFTTIRHITDKSSDRFDSSVAYRNRLMIAGPLCGIFAVLIQGLTDYSWYNYRAYLMFWMVAGLVPALSKNARKISDEVQPDEASASELEAALSIKIVEDN